jgi:hypothetical protein
MIILFTFLDLWIQARDLWRHDVTIKCHENIKCKDQSAEQMNAIV